MPEPKFKIKQHIKVISKGSKYYGYTGIIIKISEDNLRYCVLPDVKNDFQMPIAWFFYNEIKEQE